MCEKTKATKKIGNVECREDPQHSDDKGLEEPEVTKSAKRAKSTAEK